uniref:Uncharacterized protein n=1 Tax=Strigamia maritima TaxID=126957 RepID=T1IQ12_STRMM
MMQRPIRPPVPFQRRTSASNGEIDEYANLMSPKEKEWLIKIQLLQLQTNNPYLDDYYYTSYLMKQKALEKNREGDTEGEEPKLLLPELTKTETRTYTPEQFEGSLGKLQAVSVNYPRKIIDLGIFHPEDADGEITTNKDLRKFRQALLEIEMV